MRTISVSIKQLNILRDANPKASPPAVAPGTAVKAASVVNRCYQTAADLLVLPRVSLDALQLDARDVHPGDLAHLEDDGHLVLGSRRVERLALEHEPVTRSNSHNNNARADRQTRPPALAGMAWTAAPAAARTIRCVDP